MPETPLLREPLARAHCQMNDEVSPDAWDSCPYQTWHRNTADAILARLANDPEGAAAVERMKDEVAVETADGLTPTAVLTALAEAIERLAR